jgi:hypothetical protein
MESVVRVIFLDVDGVLNNSDFFSRISNADKQELYDPDSVETLNKIVDQSKARLVISSTWRLLHPYTTLRAIFRRNGIRGTILDYTPELTYVEESLVKRRERGHEIQQWLDDQEVKPDGFVILDDDSDMAHLLPSLVKTSFARGLQEEHIEPVLQILMK